MHRSSSPLAHAAALLLLSGAAQAATPDWSDIDGRIQYGWYSEDARALGEIETLLAGGEGDEPLRGYYGALADWRSAELALAGGKAHADAARAGAGRCVASLDRALKSHDDFAEGLALQATCLALRGELEGWRTPLAGSRAADRMTQALRLAPGNPRVRLLDALGEYRRAADRSGRARALELLRAATNAFETERAGVAHVPGWGAADAWLALAQGRLDAGDAAGARDALEHALLLAPEFEAARRLMQRLLAG